MMVLLQTSPFFIFVSLLTVDNLYIRDGTETLLFSVSGVEVSGRQSYAQYQG